MLPHILILQVLQLLALADFIGPEVTGPHMSESFADPSIIWDGDNWYGFATHIDDGTANVPVAMSPDFENWSYLGGYDAMPTRADWAIQSGGNYATAPDVNRLDDGSYVMYFDATEPKSGRNCVGAAKATSVAGPYTPLANTLVCPVAQGGAIDASGFIDRAPASEVSAASTGKRYLLYKIDGNMLGNGGNCNNAIAPFARTPIMLQEVEADGVTFVGKAIEILDNNGNEDVGIVEAPSLVRTAEGVYVLFFSTGCFADGSYTVSYATSWGVTGPYSRGGKLLTTQVSSDSKKLWSPGGMDVWEDGRGMAFHAYDSTHTRRVLFTDVIQINGTRVYV